MPFVVTTACLDIHYWNPPSEIEARVRAFESLLVERGYAQHDAIDAMVDAFENDLGPLYGARVVAKAWSDPEFKARSWRTPPRSCTS